VKTKPKRLFTSVRPARIACLISEQDADWQESSLRIIEFFSRVWGGGNNIIVPTDGNDLSVIFWKLLYVYDADYIYYFHKSGLDQKIVHPEEHRSRVEAALQDFLKAAPSADVNRTREQIDEQFCRTPLMAPPTAELGERIKSRLAPFFVEGNVIDSISSRSPVRFPLAPLITVLSESHETAGSLDFRPPLNGTYSLWLASITGSGEDTFRNEMREIKRQVFDVDLKDDLMELVTNPRAVNTFTSGTDVKTPFELTTVGLGTYFYRSEFPRKQLMTIVVGDTINDFCFYYSLSRIRQPVLWFPINWLRETKSTNGGSMFDSFSHSLGFTQGSVGAEDGCVFTSTSLELEELTQIVDETKKRARFLWLRSTSAVELTLDCAKLISRPFRLYEVGNAVRPTSLTAEESSEIDMFETPTPKNFRRVHPYDHRWITDVTVSAHSLPRHPNIGEWVIRSPVLGTWGARVGAGTLSYFCPNVAYAGGDIDITVVRPNLYIPSAHEVFEKLFDGIGQSVRLSDKGFYADDAVRKFGGLEVLASFLRDSISRQLLYAFMDCSGKNSEHEGYLLSDGRRYLTLPAVSRLAGDDEISRNLIEKLLSQDIFYRGCIFKCRYCRNADWFGLDQFDQIFRCKRCQRTQHVTRENHVYGELEPGWCYKLDEIIFQFLKHNGDVGILALDYERRGSQTSFLFTTDLELRRAGAIGGKPDSEIDICCLVDGEIVLGEAKKENRLGQTKRAEVKEINKYTTLADVLGVKRLIFATLAEAWSDETMTNVKNATASRNIDVTMLNTSNLLMMKTQ